MHCSDTAGCDGSKYFSRREVIQRDHRNTVGYGSGHREYHTEAVEHRHLDQESVLGGEVHAVTDALTVVENISVSEHNALRETCRTGCVLHVADFVRFCRIDHGAQIRIADLAVCRLELIVPEEAAVIAVVDRDNVL